MKNLSVQLLLGLLSYTTVASTAYAQPSFIPDPDPALWNHVINPSGQQAVPVVFYEPTTGVLYLDSRGIDRVSNTIGGSTISGDDVGTISLLVRGPEPLALLSPFNDSNFHGNPTWGLLWSYQYFNGRAQLIGVGTNQFIPPGVHPIFRYEPGHGLDDWPFQDVEMAINFVPMAPGANLFGSVQFVPEPAALYVIATVLCGIGIVRRRGSGLTDSLSFRHSAVAGPLRATKMRNVTTSASIW